jgi:hypothetical protein
VGVAIPAEKLGDLGLDGGLHEQAYAHAGHLLEDLAEVTFGGEQLIDVGADALYGGYSCGHGCGFLSLLAGLEGNLRPSSIYTEDRTPPGTIRRVPIRVRRRSGCAGTTAAGLAGRHRSR